MKILFVSRWFAPRDIIGAVRPTQLCKYLAQNGNEVMCIAEEYGDKEFSDESLLPVKTIRVKAGRVGTYSINHSNKAAEARKNTSSSLPQKSQKSSLVSSLRKIAAVIMHIIDELEWSHRAINVIKKNNDSFCPDVIVTSYGPESSVLFGLQFKKRHPDIAWISDMRDPMTHSQQPNWRKRINSRWEKRMSKSADAITTISEALGEKYRGAYGHRNVGVFVNGFDPEDSCEDLVKNDGVLRIGYTGALYGGRRKMEALFEAIKTIESSRGEQAPIELHYAGGDAAELFNQAKNYDVEKYIVNHGLLSREKAQQLQEECDILCVLSWNTNEEKGVLTGKFPEYLRLKKNVLALISGEVSDAELTSRINNMHCGFSYEYCGGAESFKQLVEWLDKMVEMKSTGVVLASMIDNEAIEEYSYKQISANYESFLKKVRESKGQ